LRNAAIAASSVGAKPFALIPDNDACRAGIAGIYQRHDWEEEKRAASAGSLKHLRSTGMLALTECD